MLTKSSIVKSSGLEATSSKNLQTQTCYFGWITNFH